MTRHVVDAWPIVPTCDGRGTAKATDRLQEGSLRDAGKLPRLTALCRFSSLLGTGALHRRWYLRARSSRDSDVRDAGGSVGDLS
jgi:hypothetical protein